MNAIDPDGNDVFIVITNQVDGDTVRDRLPELLVNECLPRESVRPLIAKIIRADGFDWEVAFALLTRPDPYFREATRRNAKRYSTSPNTEYYVFALACGQRLGDDVSRAYMALLARTNLSAEIRSAVRTLLWNARVGEAPSWDDVLELAL